MKKSWNMFLFIVLLVGAFAIPVSVQATVSAYEINIFASLVNDDTNSIIPQSVEVLYDLSGNPSFLIADVLPHGFAIIFRDAAEISELITSEGAVNPYLTARGRKIYAGPMLYIDYYDGVYTDLLRRRELNDNAVRHMSAATEDALDNIPEPPLFQPFSVSARTYIIGGDYRIRNAGFGDNVNGTCGQIAASIILVYYEKRERSRNRPRYRVVPEHLFPRTLDVHEDLHNEMMRHMGNRGTSPTSIRNGLNNYFNATASRRVLGMSASTSRPMFQTVVDHAANEVRAHRPSIVTTGSRPANAEEVTDFSHHAMVAYGFRIEGDQVTHLIVHTGWWAGWRVPWVGERVSVAWFNGIITVSPPTEPLPRPELRLNTGGRMALSRHVIPSVTNIWRSSDPSIATVDHRGQVRGTGPGSVTITHVADAGFETTFVFEISQPMRRITVERPTSQQRRLRVNQNGTGGCTFQIRATADPLNSTDIPLRWSSSNTSVATVNQNGVVTARGRGNAIITVTCAAGRRSRRVRFNVAYNPTSVRLTNRGNPLTAIELNANSSFRPRVEFTPARLQICSNARNVTWTSSNTSVATVDARGTVRAVRSGNATITARTVNGRTASFSVRSVIPVSSVSINPLTPAQSSSLTVAANGLSGTSLTLNATVLPASATSRGVVWASSNPNIISVSNTGVVTARGVGRATITATSTCAFSARRRTATVTLNVTRR